MATKKQSILQIANYKNSCPGLQAGATKAIINQQGFSPYTLQLCPIQDYSFIQLAQSQSNKDKSN
jgi:hypothetical protein